MNNFRNIQAHLHAESNNHHKGKKFEKICKWFLENDPGYTAQIKQVWFWENWPGNWGRDKGIDLIAETHDGKIWAIQAKAYDENISSISKTDIDSFLSESSRKPIDFRLLIATTNAIGANAREVIDGQEKPISLCLLDTLEASPLDWSACLNDAETPLKKERFSPRPHQEKALTDIIAGFEQSPRGQLHMACGTGKTLVGLWLAERLKSNTTLVLVPSISLVAQLYREWSKSNSEQFSFYPLFVCSDITVNRKNDDDDAYIVHAADIGFPVTTNAQDIVDTLSRVSQPKVIFATYHSSPVIKEACELDPSLTFDLVIADEAHRCAGKASSDFATITKKDAIRRNRTLFMTATPRFFTSRVKKITQELLQEIVSMDDPNTFGPVFHTLPFSDAIKDGLLTDYQIVISGIGNKKYREYADNGRLVSTGGHETDARTLASQIMLAKAIKEYGLTRVISFHSRNKSAQEFVDSFPHALALLDEKDRPTIHFKATINGNMPQSDRSKILRKFKAPAPEGAALLANVRCLSEGVDVPTLDGIIFIDPKGSETDIIQAVGRAIRKAEHKHIGIILVPIFVDNVADEQGALEQSCFKPIVRVINALRAHDDILAEELDSIRLELGKRIYKSPPKFTKIKIDISVDVGAEFSDSINLKIIERCATIYLDKSHSQISPQWHSLKNNDLLPSKVVAGSHSVVWWKCPVADDHEWQASIKQRALAGNGCPMCRGSIVVLSNSLGYNYPEFVKEWHPMNDPALTPHNIHFGSKTKVLWQCLRNSTHYWPASVENRVSGSNCPFCCNQKVIASNSLAFTHPEASNKWHHTLNGDLTPHDVVAGSPKIVWWKCSVADDHEWEASIRSIAIVKGKCPICLNRKVVKSNCLATLHPALSLEWHSNKNNISPFDVVPGYTKKVWWLCSKNHEWDAAVCDRVKKESGCPYCWKKHKYNEPRST